MELGDVPYDDIKKAIESTSADRMLEELNSSGPDLVSRINKESYDLLHDRDMCKVLGINYGNPSVDNGYLKANYAALLIVKKDEEQNLSVVSGSLQ